MSFPSAFRFICILACFAALCGIPSASAAPKKGKAPAAEAAPQKMPWGLRDHFSFTVERGALDYSATSAEWRVRMDESRVLADEVCFAIHFKDGRTLNSENLPKSEAVRGKGSTPFGDGNHYTITFPEKEGLVIEHRVETLSDRPFVLLAMRVTNATQAPIELTKISPAVIGPGNLTDLGAEATVLSRAMTVRGGQPVFSREAAPAWMLFHNKAQEISLAMGVIPAGRANSGVNLKPHAGGWQGEIFCDYAPLVRLAPGETLTTDPVWISYGVKRPSLVNLYYSWAYSLAPNPEGAFTRIPAWITVDERDGSLDALSKQVTHWAGTGIKHILVPAAWASRPGDLDGAAPRYPRKFQSVPTALRALGMTPGVTVDPLAAADGDDAWTAKSADGQRWLNLSKPEARQHAGKNIAKLAGWGFEFFVIESSLIPDEVLAAFGMSRAEADFRAIEAVRAAAPGKPVYAGTAAPVKASLDAWLEAAGAACRMAEFDVRIAPLRFDAGAAAQVNDQLLAAMRLWPGPVEFVGRPKPEAEKALAKFIALPRLTAWPVDAEAQSPRLWQVAGSAKGRDEIGSAILSFPGAPAWTQADLDVDAGKNLALWRGRDGKFVEANASVNGTESLDAYGLHPVNGRPSFLGTSSAPALDLDRVDSVSWDDSKGILVCKMNGANGPGTRAYVHVPPPWTLKSGKAGGKTVSQKDAGPILAFELDQAATSFELRFSR